jgi:hypothetical protein
LTSPLKKCLFGALSTLPVYLSFLGHSLFHLSPRPPTTSDYALPALTGWTAFLFSFL